MGLFDRFKKTNVQGKEDRLGVDEAQGTSGEMVETTLSYHPSWDIPQEQHYVFQFLANELEPLHPNQLSLSGIDIDQAETGWYVKAFVRNTLERELKLGMVELSLLDEAGKQIASKEFNFDELGEIPSRGARPWVFEFEKSFFDRPFEDLDIPSVWQLAFNVASMTPHRLDLHEKWDAQLTDEQKEDLRRVVANLPKVKRNEINLVGFQIKQDDEGTLAISAFIRNGSTQLVTFEKLPLEVVDANGELIARGSFNLDNIQVKPNTSFPWSFVFPEEMVVGEQPDLSRWMVRIPADATTN